MRHFLTTIAAVLCACGADPANLRCADDVSAYCNARIAGWCEEDAEDGPTDACRARFDRASLRGEDPTRADAQEQRADALARECIALRAACGG